MDNKVICSEEDLIAVANATRKKTGQTSAMTLQEMANEINSMSYEGGEYVEQDPTVPSWAKQPNKPTYTAEEVGARPADWMPTAEEIGVVAEESDPTVPAWAKEAEKPAYAWDEITDKPFTDGKLNPECLPEDIGGGSENAVEYTEQTLTEEQKAQARKNIGAAPAYTYGKTDLTAGVSPLHTGTLYFVYE